MKVIASIKLLIVTMLLLCGCSSNHTGIENNHSSIVRFANYNYDKVNYLCVGMEMSMRFGACPGCEVDVMRMSNILKNRFGYNGCTLISSQATKRTVVSKLKDGIDKTPENGLFIFIYSGHGGQERLGGIEPSGADISDEYLCLYDTYMLDDEIWNIISSCKGRVFMYFDACHSATMYRSVASEKTDRSLSTDNGVAVALEANDIISSKGFTFNPDKFIEASALSVDGERNSIRLLCWSGCKEMEYSYGSVAGGVMTRAVVSYLRSGMSYDQLWDEVSNVVQAHQPTQHPVRTKIGNWPSDMEAFK